MGYVPMLLACVAALLYVAVMLSLLTTPLSVPVDGGFAAPEERDLECARGVRGGFVSVSVAGDVVVGKMVVGISERGSDGVSADVAAGDCGRGVTGGDVVTVDDAGECAGEWRVGGAVESRFVIGFDSEWCFIHREDTVGA